MFKKIMEAIGCKLITAHGKSGTEQYWQLPEDNPVCKRLGHVYSRKSKEGTGYDSAEYCFRCGLSNWDGPWG